MKFRAILKDPRAFLVICNTIRTFSKKALLKLHAEQIRAIAVAGDSFDGAQLWASVRADSLFADLRVESRNGNAIFCDVPDIGQLVFALRACENAANIVIRLAKVENRQLLTFSVQGSAVAQDVTHEVAIRVLTDTEIARIAAPPLEPDTVEVYFPPLVEVQAFLESAKAAGSPTCSVRLYPITADDALAANAAGGIEPRFIDAAPHDGGGGGPATTAALTLAAEGVTSSVELHYASISAPSGVILAPAPVDVTVDLKRLARFLGVKEANPASIVMHLAARRALVLSAFAASDINLVYYLPAVLR